MMMSLLSSLFLGLVATNAQNCPPPNCPPLEECGPDMMMCMDPLPPPPMCPPMTCPGDCPPVDPCPTGHCIPMESKYKVYGCFQQFRSYMHLITHFSAMPNPFSRCPNFCPPPPCPEGSVACPVDYDASGCPMPPTCAPQPMCGEPMQCPQSHGPDGCPVQPQCGPEEMLCTPPAPPLPPNFDPGMSRPGEFCPPAGWCTPNTGKLFRQLESWTWFNIVVFLSAWSHWTNVSQLLPS